MTPARNARVLVVDDHVEMARVVADHLADVGFLTVHVERAIADRRLRDEHRALQKLASERSSFASMVGRSAPMRELYQLIERVAPASAPVLLRGESGTGKELVARALHFGG